MGRRYRAPIHVPTEADTTPRDRAPVRVWRRREKGWRMPEGAVYVGRPSRYGNPYRPQTYRFGIRSFDAGARLRSVRAHARYLLDRPLLCRRIREELQGRDLACWCFPHEPCHADTLLIIANCDQGAIRQLLEERTLIIGGPSEPLHVE